MFSLNVNSNGVKAMVWESRGMAVLPPLPLHHGVPPMKFVEEHRSEVRAVCEGWSSAVLEPCFKFSFIVIFFTNWIYFLFNINVKILWTIGWTSCPPPSPCYAWLWLELAQGLFKLLTSVSSYVPLLYCIQRTLFLCWFTTGNSHHVYSAPSPTMIPEPGQEWYSPQVLLRAELLQSPNRCTLPPVGLCSNHHTNASLLRAGNQLIDGDNDNSPGVHLILSLAE